MGALLTRIRSHLSYATVVSGLTAFVVLCGGAAFAADQLAKNSVGKKQLKANAVTTAKIKKNAVTAAKIKAGAVDGSKVKAGSLGSGEFQLSGAPYTRIAEELRANVSIAAPGGMEPFVTTPLPGISYTQEAGRTDSYVGAVDVSFAPTCTGARQVLALVLMDLPPGLKLFPTPDPEIILYIVAAGSEIDPGTSGQATKRVNLSSYSLGGTRFAPATAQSHTFTLTFAGICESGSGVTVDKVALDVIGTN
jgi:hypothetical protein